MRNYKALKRAQSAIQNPYRIHTLTNLSKWIDSWIRLARLQPSISRFAARFGSGSRTGRIFLSDLPEHGEVARVCEEYIRGKTGLSRKHQRAGGQWTVPPSGSCHKPCWSTINRERGSRRLLPKHAISSLCVLQDVHICSFGPFRPFTGVHMTAQISIPVHRRLNSKIFREVQTKEKYRYCASGATGEDQIFLWSIAISSGGRSRKSASNAKTSVIVTRRPSAQLSSNPDVANTRKPRHNTAVVVHNA